MKGGAFVGVPQANKFRFHDLGYCFVVEHTRGVDAQHPGGAARIRRRSGWSDGCIVCHLH